MQKNTQGRGTTIAQSHQYPKRQKRRKERKEGETNKNTERAGRREERNWKK